MPQPFTQELVDRLARAQHVAALTGAGISAESGIPTFRDPDGLWQKFKPEELAVAEINVQSSAIAGRVDEVVLGRAGDVLPRLVAAVKQALEVH